MLETAKRFPACGRHAPLLPFAPWPTNRVSRAEAARANQPHACAAARKVVGGWLVSPGHCAHPMGPQLSEPGAAYASDPESDAGIYRAAPYGAP